MQDTATPEWAIARGDHWKRVAVEVEQDRDRLLAMLDAATADLARARSLRLADPSKAVDPGVHTPGRVTAHLRRLGWVRVGGAEISELWDNSDPAGRVMVPLITDAVDYTRVVGFLVSSLASLYGVGELQVLADIAGADDV